MTIGTVTGPILGTSNSPLSDNVVVSSASFGKISSTNLQNALTSLDTYIGGVQLNKLTMVSVSAAGVFTIPAKGVIKDIIIYNNNGNAITGGLKIGTTNGGTEVVVALAVGANALVPVLDAALVKRIFSLTAPTTLYYDAVVAWNNATLDLRVIYETIA